MVRSIGNLSGLEMGRLLRHPVSFSTKDLPGAGLVHCHLRPGHFPSQQCHRFSVSTGEMAYRRQQQDHFLNEGNVRMVSRRSFTVHPAFTPFFIRDRLILISKDRGFRRLGQTSSGERERGQRDAARALSGQYKLL